RSPRDFAKQCERDPRKDIAATGTAPGKDRRACALHVWCIDRVACRLQRKIRLDRGTHVEGPAVEQRPAAICALGFAKISGDSRLNLGLDAVEIVLQQNKFRRYRRVGLQLEDPVAVRMLQSQK